MGRRKSWKARQCAAAEKIFGVTRNSRRLRLDIAKMFGCGKRDRGARLVAFIGIMKIKSRQKRDLP